MKLTNYEVRLLARAFLVLEPEMTFAAEERILSKSGCSFSALYELRDKCETHLLNHPHTADTTPLTELLTTQ